MSQSVTAGHRSEIYRFERTTLDVARGVLLVDGAECRLRPKSFALLQLLVENAGRVVDRDEIMRAVWTDTFVTDDSITQCIKEIRRAVGDEGARVVRTLPKRGYMFTATVQRAETHSVAPLAPPLPDKPSIAVLPFQNMSGDPDQEYFADGTVEEITTALSRIRWLFVIARNSAFTYKGPAIDIRQAGRELGVRYVLEGSVRKSGNRVRVTAQLINAISGTHIWADRYDHELNDIFAVQDAIATAIAGILDPELTGAEQQRVMRKPLDKPDAWETFQRGLWHFHKYTAADNKIAQTFYRQVIGIDPGFAPGHYGLVNALLWDVWLYGTKTAPEIQPECVRESRIAVALDDRDAVARALYGVVMLGEGEWDIGLAEARVAYSLNPNNGFVAAAVGKTAGFAGLQDEGIEYLRRAMRLSPRDPLTWGWLWWMAVFQYYARDFAGALATLTRVAGMRAGFPYLYMFIAASLAFLGRQDEARAMFDRLRAEVPGWRRWVEDRPAWLRPEDYELRLEGVRRAAGTSFDTE